MPAPANDNFASRQVLSGPSGSFGPTDNSAATSEAGEPNQGTCGSSGGPYRTLWYEWTPAASANVTFDTIGSPDAVSGDLDTILAVYTGAALGSLTLVGCNDDKGGSFARNSLLTFAAVAGTTYLIQVGTYLGAVGTVILNWNQDVVIAPSNTDCASAELLVGCSGTVMADNRGWAGVWPTGADPLFNANGEGGGAPLWYRWRNPTGHPLLFRITVESPPANPVDYNLGIAVAADCGSVTFDDSLASTYFQLAQERGNIEGTFVADDFDPSSPTSYDLVVDPGHSAYLEVDSWTGDTAEPPTADSSHRGQFKFDWAALEYTKRDTTQGAVDTLPADASELLVTGLDGGAASVIAPYATLLLDGRIFLLWASNDTHGISIWGGDCLPDGSDLHSQKIWDNGTSTLPDPTTGDVPRLFSDGTDVFIGFPWYDTDGPQNPGYTGDCATDPHQPVFLCDECTTGSNLWRYSIYQWDAGTWDPLYSIGDLAAGSESFVPHITDVGHTPYTDFAVRVAASDAMPGKIWVHAAYTVTQLDESLHFNDYPITETPPGALYCTRDRVYVVEYLDTFEIDVASAAATLIARDQHELAEIEHWDHDDPTVDPAFGTWQFFDNGPWVTSPDGNFASAIYTQFDVRCDDGFPLVVYSARLTRDSTDATYANEIVFARLDTGTVLGTWTYDDVALGFESNTTLVVSSLYMGERFAHPDTAALERGVASLWVDPAAVLTARSWTNRIKSDGSTAPDGVIAGDFTSSGTNKLYPTLFPDPGRDGQWWGITGPAPGTGGAFASEKNTFHLYELCDPAWTATYNPQSGPDALGSDTPISQRCAFDTTGEYFYFINSLKQVRRAKVLRDYFICEEGSPCVIADIAGLKHNRQRLGVA